MLLPKQTRGRRGKDECERQMQSPVTRSWIHKQNKRRNINLRARLWCWRLGREWVREWVCEWGGSGGGARGRPVKGRLWLKQSVWQGVYFNGLIMAAPGKKKYQLSKTLNNWNGFNVARPFHCVSAPFLSWCFLSFFLCMSWAHFSGPLLCLVLLANLVFVRLIYAHRLPAACCLLPALAFFYFTKLWEKPSLLWAASEFGIKKWNQTKGDCTKPKCGIKRGVCGIRVCVCVIATWIHSHTHTQTKPFKHSHKKSKICW